MTTLETLTVVGLMGLGATATLDMYFEMEAKAMAYSDADITQKQCYKAGDFKCTEARVKFEKLKGE